MKMRIRLGKLFFIGSLVFLFAFHLAMPLTASQVSETSIPVNTGPAPPPSQPSPSAGSIPTVAIISPAHNANLPTGDVTVFVRVTNFNGISKLGGLIFYFMDVDAPISPFIPATTAPDTYIATTETTCTWKNVKPGMHTFAVLLVNRDYTPLMPPVTAKITVQVAATTESPGPILSPSSVIREPLTSLSTNASTSVAASPAAAESPLPAGVKVPPLAISAAVGVVIALTIAILLVLSRRKRNP